MKVSSVSWNNDCNGGNGNGSSNGDSKGRNADLEENAEEKASIKEWKDTRRQMCPVVE